MPIVSVTRWQIDPERASNVIREAAPLLRAQGASQVNIGLVHTGQHAGQTTVSTTYSDWETYGRAMRAQQEDQKFQELHRQTTRDGAQLQERILLTIDEVQ